MLELLYFTVCVLFVEGVFVFMILECKWFNLKPCMNYSSMFNISDSLEMLFADCGVNR